MKLNTQYLYVILLNKYELRENQCSEKLGLFKGVNEALSSMFTFFFRVGEYSVQEMTTNDY